MKKTKKGFTLIELLVVIGIIGLLASLAIVSLNSARAKARDAVRIANMQRIITGLEQFYDGKTHYPSIGTVADTAIPMGFSQSVSPINYITGLYGSGFMLMSATPGTLDANCSDAGRSNITAGCDLELVVPMPREPMISGADVTGVSLCLSGTQHAGAQTGWTGVAAPCDYTYFAVDSQTGGRGWQDFNIAYALESAAPKAFGDGLKCVSNKRGTKCSTIYGTL